MDWLTFTSSMVDHLVWPLVLVGILWFLFKNLDYIAEKIESIKFKDIEFSFRKDVKDLKNRAEALNVTVFYPAAQLTNFGASPENDRAVVLNTGNSIQELLQGWAQRKGFLEKGAGSTLEKMRRERVINDDLFHLTRRLLNIRNKAAHAPSVALTHEEMSEFLGIAKSVQDRLKTAIG